MVIVADLVPESKYSVMLAYRRPPEQRLKGVIRTNCEEMVVFIFITQCCVNSRPAPAGDYDSVFG
jgi:hypothetical protein